jgi:hypothetical protein
MTQNTKDAVPSQTLDEQAATLQRVYDLVGMGALARTPGILLANLENMKRRSDCLSGIEQLFTYEVPDDDMPDEMTDECDLNWGQGRAEYVETFKAALPAFIARHPEYASTAEQAEGVRVDEVAVVKSLIDVVRATFIALDDSEEGCGDDGRIHVIDSANFDAVCTAMESLEELPDDQPGYTMDAPGKAEWALRNLFAARSCDDAALAGKAVSTRYIVIGYGESDYPQASFANDHDELLDAVLGMIYTRPSDACADTREEYSRDLADEDEWCGKVWRTEFEIGGIVVYDLGYGTAASSAGDQA